MTENKFTLWHGQLCIIKDDGTISGIDCPLDPEQICTTECEYLSVYGPCADMPTIAILTCVEPNVEIKLEDYNA